MSPPRRFIPGARGSCRSARTARSRDHTPAWLRRCGVVRGHRLLGLPTERRGRGRDPNTSRRVRLAPHDERSGIALGTTLTEAGKLSAAEHALRQTIEAVPASGVARWSLAVVYDLQNRGPDALSTLDEVVALPIVAGKAAVYWRIAQLADRHTIPSH